MKIYTETSKNTLKKVIITFEEEWWDFTMAEILLNLDDTWRTPKELRRNCKYMKEVTSHQINRLLKTLKEKGLAENKIHSQKVHLWRRTHQFPKHKGLDMI